MQINRTGIIAGLLAFALLALPLNAQNRTRFGGAWNAVDYAYGIGPNVAGLTVDIGGAAGAATLTVAYGYTTAGDGTSFAPLATTAPITVGNTAGANLETVTPSAVSCGTPMIADTCTVTATFTYAHGRGEVISSGTIGLQEAVNLAQAAGGGGVAISPVWASLGGTDSMINGKSATAPVTPYATVVLEDNRGTRPGLHWAMQPSTVSLLAAPATLAAATVYSGTACATGHTCTWAAAQPYFRVAYVDALGQLTIPSTGYQVAGNLTASVPVVIVSPAASAGAVGWIPYAGASSAASFVLPVTTAAGVSNGSCVLTTLETVIPACVIGSNATIDTLYSNTNMDAGVAATASANAAYPVFQAHTTFAYEPTANPVPFQSNFGPFPANTASASSTDKNVVGTFSLPTGYLNQIGRTIRISGKVAATVVTAGIPTVIVALGWQGGYSTGAPTEVCTVASVAVVAGTAVLMPFSCTLTTYAVGTTAIGSVITEGMSIANGATTAAIPGTDAGTATPVGSLGLFSQNNVFIKFEDNGQASTAAQLVSLHVETIQ